MSHRKLHKPKALQRLANYHWDARTDALERWSTMPNAAEADDPNTISIFDVIGEDFFHDGFTAKRMAGALRAIGKNDVTVKINSPGGDMFEGIAIYNLLREHPAKVNVSIVGIAASAASVIAMAGDEVRMGLGTFLMVHNAWGLVIGNRHDMSEASDLFESFDAALADIYEARTGMSRNDLEKLMDAETFMGPSEAIEKGFAEKIDEGVSVSDAPQTESNREVMAIRKVDAMLAKLGVPRSERRTLLNDVKRGTQDAAPHATQDAGDLSALTESLRALHSTIGK